ncbi:Peptidoglycan/LPS O-acetylase OafA/YrhL, contains acyltransferase and SGNH-hydrolase domains [Micromonospora pallida]|uniref:Peptidoglycan/LPS O-acetylase OafA/YrhL, contains acyltransferase and SGNH-hydrolase domains n=1 Tax=Micromonospora pallida TaxID=145854 RepID=A0A1C6TJV2_9ACTN|nr:acyltransferase [Micromonospora pallida]SCL42036.1 Peptidoglycan/LPS O-acetylase OafA/YrhL, contains acyltransferase and SGNH-hydrolase domains [Micromonospora pallida]
MRNRYLDLLRFLAIIRVVVYHVTGWATLTLVFPAMSVMFALAGSLMAASLDRSGPAAVGRRLRRLLPSLWVAAAIFVPAMLLIGGLPLNWRLLLWLFPITDPPANGWGALALSVIWYLRDYLWFVLASPLALWLFRRAPLPTLITPYVLLVVVELGFPGAPVVLRDFGLYFGAWLLGFAHHDGMLRRMSRRVLVTVAAVLATAGAAWIFTHPGARGYDLNDIRIGNALWAAAFILIALGLAPSGAAWVDRNARFGRLVTIFNRRALTVYLWHMPFVVALTPLVDVVGWSHQNLLGLAIRVALVFALVGVMTVLVGWVEDVAARRRPELLPGGRRTRPEPTRPTDAVPAATDGPRPAVPAAIGGSRPAVPAAIDGSGPVVRTVPRAGSAAAVVPRPRPVVEPISGPAVEPEPSAENAPLRVS